MAKKGEHKKTKPDKKVSELSHMGKWRRENPKKYQEWRRKYRQTAKSNARNKARRLLERSGREKKCAVCGIRDKLEVHHKNGNPFDNRLSNLEWRCPKHNARGKNAKKEQRKS